MTKSKKILNIFTAVIVGLFLACTIASFAIRAATQPKVETTQAWEYDFSLGDGYAQILTVPRAALLSKTRSFTDEEGTEYTWEQYYVYVATSSLGLFSEVYDAERINVKLFPSETIRRMTNGVHKDYYQADKHRRYINTESFQEYVAKMHKST